jgi:hypothetical protein
MTPKAHRASLLVSLALTLGCLSDLHERTALCPASAKAESAYSWGHTVALRPAPGYEWTDIVCDPFREYGTPRVTTLDLERRYGPPSRSWSIKGRPFVEYLRPEGRLQLGLEEEKSGSAAYRSWRLRLEPREAQTSKILERTAFACISDLQRPNMDILILSRRSGLAKVSVIVRSDRVRELIWLNLATP